jgi:hypothetical protein
MSYRIRPGDTVSWQGSTQAMNGIVQRDNGAQYVVRVFPGVKNRKGGDDHSVDAAKLTLIRRGNV